MKKSIEDLRADIDTIDQKLLDFISERVELARQIGKLKREQGIELLDQDRRQEVLEKWTKTLEKAGISEGDSGKIYTLIHDLSIIIERRSA
jgi:chorismate mutase